MEAGTEFEFTLAFKSFMAFMAILIFITGRWLYNKNHLLDSEYAKRITGIRKNDDAIKLKVARFFKKFDNLDPKKLLNKRYEFSSVVENIILEFFELRFQLLHNADPEGEWSAIDNQLKTVWGDFWIKVFQQWGTHVRTTTINNGGWYEDVEKLNASIHQLFEHNYPLPHSCGYRHPDDQSSFDYLQYQEIMLEKLFNQLEDISPWVLWDVEMFYQFRDRSLPWWAIVEGPAREYWTQRVDKNSTLKRAVKEEVSDMEKKTCHETRMKFFKLPHSETMLGKITESSLDFT